MASPTVPKLRLGTTWPRSHSGERISQFIPRQQKMPHTFICRSVSDILGTVTNRPFVLQEPVQTRNLKKAIVYEM